MSTDPKYKNLVELYQRSVRQYGSNPLFGVKERAGWKWSTYADFGRQVDALRGGMAALGVVAGDHIGIISNNRPEWAIAAYATFGLGAAFVPMYESQIPKDWEYILRDSEAKVVFVANDDIRSAIAAVKNTLPKLEHIISLSASADRDALLFVNLVERGAQHPADVLAPRPEDVSALIYTSGTTSNPKGVVLSHENIASNVCSIHQAFPMISENDRSLSFLPWAHCFGQVAELHFLLSKGAAMALSEGPDKIITNIGEVKPTLLVSVPRIFNRIYDGLQKKMAEEGGLKKRLFEAAMANAESRRNQAECGNVQLSVEIKHRFFDRLVFSKIRERFGGRLAYAVSGGAAMSVEVARFIDNLGITVYEGYGLSEASPVVSVNRPNKRKIGSVGPPLPGVRVEVDKSQTHDPEQGEIIVYGPNVMKGYFRLPEETKEALRPDGGLRTGDMGYVDSDGFLYITGRVKEQYKLENGKYVAPAPLEEQLKLSGFIANVMVFGDNRPYNVALIVPDAEALRHWAKQQNLTTSSLEELVTRPAVQELIQSELRTYSKDFRPFERIKKFALITEDFTTENGMLTPSLKVKRRTVMERYGNLLFALY